MPQPRFSIAERSRRATGLLAALAFAIAAFAQTPNPFESEGDAAPAEATKANSRFQDPLATPAQPSKIVAHSPMTAIAQAGNRLVAVGPRGHVLVSDDVGATWKQIPLDLSSDLVAVRFSSKERGWIVGHDGVVLRSTDGGDHWEKVLDGRSAAQIAFDYYQPLATGVEEAPLDKALRDADFLVQDGPDKPFLDVWFDDADTGYIVGAFNLALQTRDGGQTWIPLLDRIDNPMGLHLYAINRVGGELYIAGEQGLLLKLDTIDGRFKRIETPYQGTFFGVTGNDSVLVVHGLRGNIFRSEDRGATWEHVDAGITTAIAGGTTLPDGTLVLATQLGQLAISRDQGRTFELRVPQPAMALSQVSPIPNDTARVAIAGSRGVRVEPLN